MMVGGAAGCEGSGLRSGLGSSLRSGLGSGLRSGLGAEDR